MWKKSTETSRAARLKMRTGRMTDEDDTSSKSVPEDERAEVVLADCMTVNFNYEYDVAEVLCETVCVEDDDCVEIDDDEMCFNFSEFQQSFSCQTDFDDRPTSNVVYLSNASVQVDSTFNKISVSTQTNDTDRTIDHTKIPLPEYNDIVDNGPSDLHDIQLPMPVTEEVLFVHEKETIDLTCDNTCIEECSETIKDTIIYDDNNVGLVEPLPKKIKTPVTLQELLDDDEKKKHYKSSTTESQYAIINKDIFIKPYISVERIMFDDNLLHYYTGLETYCKFEAVFYSLGPNVNCDLEYVYTKSCESLPPLTCFLMMLVYMRCHYPFIELSRMFSVSSKTVMNVCHTWIKFCYVQWQEIDIWPKVNVVKYFAPFDFKKKFANTRVIIDGTEMPIQKPSNPTSQRATFSSYKHKNTVKVLVGATPNGLVSFVSTAYGGSASDRQITERCTLIDKVEPGDSIMSDKGFNVQDIFANKDVKINLPTRLTGKNKFTPETISSDRKIASKRVHIERIIGNAKCYKILKSPLSSKEVAMSTEIIFVCFMLSNFRNGIVSQFA